MRTKMLRFFLISIMTLLVNIVFTQPGYAQGPGPAWTSSSPVTLSPVTPASNFQVKVILSTGQYSGMKSDGSDLRFYDHANTNCEYWIEGAFNTAGISVIWVKVPVAGTSTLLMYYGNVAATSASNGNTTFDFFDDFTSALGTNWTVNAGGGSVTQSGAGTGTVTLSLTSTSGVSLTNTSAFTPSSTSFFIETKHREVGYNRNRFYASTTSAGADPLAFDYGYFSSGAASSTTSEIFYNGFTASTLLANNTDYLTRWQITDGSTYNWFTYNYATGQPLDATTRNATFASNIRFISFSVTEVANTSTIVDWVRVRKFAASEPATFVGITPATLYASGFAIFPAGVTSATIQAWGGGGGGSTITSTGARGGGGGGGAYASSPFTVAAGTIYPVTVGTGGLANTAGGNSTFNTSTVVAAGGTGGTNNSTTAGAGGTTTGSTGTVKFAGGNGANGGGTNSGGGGGGAGSTGAGGAASGATAGTGTTLNGGNGGTGVSGSSNGNNGSNYGGGGSGAVTNSSTDRFGGSGANGQVIVTWIPCVPPAAPSVSTPVQYCLNSAAIPLTAGGSGLLWYTVASGGTSSAVAPTPLTTTTGTTAYYVSQTAGCEGPRAQIDVIVHIIPVASVTNQTNITCFDAKDGTITISASVGVSPYTFSVEDPAIWLPATIGDSRLFTGLLPNTPYRISVKDAHQCISR
jgi:hypothetical protein